jgi:hypothetical protein
MEDSTFHSWIECDFPENDSLHQFCDIDQTLPGDPSLIGISFIPLKFPLERETKNPSQSKKKPSVPSILQSRIFGFQQIIRDHETVEEKIQKF